MSVMLWGALWAQVVAHAEDADEAATIVASIEEALDDAVQRLGSVAGDSSSSSAQAAIDEVDAVEDLADALEDAAGDDATRRIASDYPDHVEDFRQAAEALVELKDEQDALEGHASRCQQADEDLIDAIGDLVNDRDFERGIDEIDDLADDGESEAEDVLDEVEDLESRLEDLRDDAKAFDVSDGPWGAVRSALASAADEVHAAFARSAAQTREACANLQKGDDHPAVKAGLASLEALSKLHTGLVDDTQRAVERARGAWEDLQDDFEDLDVDLRSHLDHSKDARAMDEDLLDDLIVALCGLDHERDGDEATRLADRLASDAAARAAEELEGITDGHTELFESLKRMHTRLHQLSDSIVSDRSRMSSHPGLSDASDTTRALVRDQLEELEEIGAEVEKARQRRKSQFGRLGSDLPALMNVAGLARKGANNPRIRAAMEYGRDQHEAMQRDCDAAEKAVPNGQFDCVTFKDCVVWEIKPSTYDMGKARSQVQGYVSGVNQLYSEVGDNEWDHCWDSDGPTRGRGFEPRIITYPGCTPSSVDP
ncbi:MAG: hypothetical protein KTR31_37145 [Myxococcales bacterium]|nr:hypothetical protein [Myxococcales bacterium]